jgi:hypothetical protein
MAEPHEEADMAAPQHENEPVSDMEDAPHDEKVDPDDIPF